MNDLSLSGVSFGRWPLSHWCRPRRAPALARSAPAGLLKLAEDQRTKVRSAYARSRKNQAR